MKKILFGLFVSLVATPCLASLNLSELLGFTLTDEKAVAGYLENGKYTEGYEGCNYGRTLVFDDESGVECAEYNYDYAYRPKAYVFIRGGRVKLVIDDEIMDARLIS